MRKLFPFVKAEFWMLHETLTVRCQWCGSTEVWPFSLCLCPFHDCNYLKWELINHRKLSLKLSAWKLQIKVLAHSLYDEGHFLLVDCYLLAGASLLGNFDSFSQWLLGIMNLRAWSYLCEGFWSPWNWSYTSILYLNKLLRTLNRFLWHLVTLHKDKNRVSWKNSLTKYA